MAIFKKNGSYYIDYYKPNGKRKREKIGPSKKLAKDVLRKRKVQMAEGKYLDKKNEEKIKFEDFADEYYELHSKQNKSCYKHDRYNIKVLKQHFSGKWLNKITVPMVKKFKLKRRKEVKPATVNRHLACLKSMFNRAIEWGKAEDNPVTKVKLFKENNEIVRYLKKEEIHKLLDNCAGHLRPIVVVAVNTGMRKGKVLSLKWENIDFNIGVITVEDTKNGDNRKLPMNKQVKKVLANIDKYPESPYVFHKDNGEPYGDIKRSFSTALKKSDIMDFRFHDLRHTFASHLVMKGVDLNRVRKLLGHKSMDMTLRYAHLSPDYQKEAVEKLDTLFEKDKMDTDMDTYMDTKEKSEEKERRYRFL